MSGTAGAARAGRRARGARRPERPRGRRRRAVDQRARHEERSRRLPHEVRVGPTRIASLFSFSLRSSTTLSCRRFSVPRQVERRHAARRLRSRGRARCSIYGAASYRRPCRAEWAAARSPKTPDDARASPASRPFSANDRIGAATPPRQRRHRLHAGTHAFRGRGPDSHPSQENKTWSATYKAMVYQASEDAKAFAEERVVSLRSGPRERARNRRRGSRAHIMT